MFIQTEATPNPATMKFLPETPVLESGTANFESADSAGGSPLAKRLFEISGVDSVYLGADFVAVTKTSAGDWQVLKPMILQGLMDHFSSGAAAVEQGVAAVRDSGDDDAIVTQIKELIDTRVRPAVAQDGGDIIFHRFEDGIVYLTMQGACSGCPSSSATLKHGIENMLRYYVPEVQEVRAAE